KAIRFGLPVRGAVLGIVVAGLAACQSMPIDSSTMVDAAQGSELNIASLTAVIERSPGDAEAYNMRGTALGRGGKYREALKDFDRAIQLNPRFYQAYANRALIWRSLNDYNRALADYEAALRINPSYDAAYIGRGSVLRLMGRTDEAFRDFERAIQLDTTDARAYHN